MTLTVLTGPFATGTGEVDFPAARAHEMLGAVATSHVGTPNS
jgi:hypothetical protein